jgi:hypothetical protein
MTPLVFPIEFEFFPSNTRKMSKRKKEKYFQIRLLLERSQRRKSINQKEGERVVKRCQKVNEWKGGLIKLVIKRERKKGSPTNKLP